jgi:hypothetical protein
VRKTWKSACPLSLALFFEQAANMERMKNKDTADSISRSLIKTILSGRARSLIMMPEKEMQGGRIYFAVSLTQMSWKEKGPTSESLNLENLLFIKWLLKPNIRS